MKRKINSEYQSKQTNFSIFFFSTFSELEQLAPCIHKIAKSMFPWKACSKIKLSCICTKPQIIKYFNSIYETLILHSSGVSSQHSDATATTRLQVPQSEVFLISLSAGFSALTDDETLQEHAANRFIFVNIWIFQ